MKMRNSAGAALAVLVAINILNFYDRNIAGAVAEPMRKEFHLSDTQIGLLASAFIWLYAVIGVPLGNVADRWSRKKLLASGMVIWSLLTGLTALAFTYAMLLFTRLGFAVGEAAVAPTATSWIGDLFPGSKRARPLALFMLGVPVGGALAYFFSGPIAQAFGWRVAMVVAAAPAALLIFPLLRLREPERGAAESRREEQHTGWRAVKIFGRIPTFWWIVASGALLNFNMYALGLFVPAFLSRVHSIGLAQAGIATGIIYAAGGVAGSLLAGWLGDHAAVSRGNGRMVWSASLAIVGAPLAYLGVEATSLAMVVVFLAIFYGTLCSYYGLVYASIQDIVAPSMRGTAMAVYFMAMYLCGASFGPLITGRLSDLMALRMAHAAGSASVTEAFKAVGLQQAMLVLPVITLALAAVLFIGSRTILADLARRETAVRTAAARA